MELSATLDETQREADNVTYSWTPASGLNYTDRATVTASPAATTTYTVRATATLDGCTTYDEKQVTVNVRPAFNAGALSSRRDTICKGGELADVTGSEATGGAGPITYRWLHNGELIDNTNSLSYNASAFAQSVGVHTFTREAKDSACVADFVPSAGSYVLTVQAPVQIAFANTSLQNQTICSGGSVTPVGILYDHASLQYSWQDADQQLNPAEVFSYMSGNNLNATITLPEDVMSQATYTYTVNAIPDVMSSKCSADSITGTVKVSPLPKVSLVSGNQNQTVCSGGTIENIVFQGTNATLSVNDMGFGVAYNEDHTNATISGSVQLTSTQHDPTEYPYTVTANSSYGCGAVSLSGVITVNPLVELTVGADSTQTLCLGGNIDAISVTHDSYSTVMVTGLPYGVNYS